MACCRAVLNTNVIKTCSPNVEFFIFCGIKVVCVGSTATMSLVNVGALTIRAKTSSSLMTTCVACLKEPKHTPFSLKLQL